MPSEGNESSQEQQPAQPQRPSGWQVLKSWHSSFYLFISLLVFFVEETTPPPNWS